MKIIHVGLGKTGTSYLQKEVFPKIAKTLNIDFFDWKTFLKKYDYIHTDKNNRIHPFNVKKKIIKEFHYNNYFISAEGLSGNFFNPLFWKKSAKINQKVFGRDATILLTFADPIEFFSSMFCQLYHAYSIKKEKDFFFNT